MITVGFSYMALNYIEVSSFFKKKINYKWLLNFVKCFSAYIAMILWFSFISLMWCVSLTDCMLNHPYIPRIILMWSWFIIFLTFCLIWFVSIVLRIFVSYVHHQRYCSLVDGLCWFFSNGFYLAFLLGWCCHNKMSLEVFPLVLFFGRILKE